MSPDLQQRLAEQGLRELKQRGASCIEIGLPHGHASALAGAHEVPGGEPWNGRESALLAVVRDLTEGDATQAGRAAAGSAPEAVVSAAPVPIVTVDASGLVQTWNPAAERMLGWPESEARGRPLPTLIANDEASGWKLSDHVMSGGHLSGVEVTLIRRDQGRLLARLSASPMHGTGNAVIGAVVVFNDGSDQKRLEEALREAEDRERLLAHLASDLVIYVCQLSPRIRVDYVSPSATQMTGVSVAKLQSHPRWALRLVHPDDRRTALAVFARPAEHPGVHRIRWLRPDASVLWTEVRNIPVYDEAGALIAVEGMLRDVSRRHQKAATDVATSLYEWSRIAPMVLLELDSEGKWSMLWASESSSAILGITTGTEQRFAQEDVQQLAPADRAAAHAALADAMATGKGAFRAHWLCPDGRYHLLSVQCIALPGSVPGSMQVIASVLDLEHPGEPQGQAPGGHAPRSSGRSAAPAKSNVAVWRRVALDFPEVGVAASSRPPHCHHCGCPALQRHQVTRRRLRDLDAKGAEVVRYRCTQCGRTFSERPAGVGRGLMSAPLRLEVTVLYGLGLSARDIGSIPADSGVELSARSVSRVAGDTGRYLRESRPAGLACITQGQQSPASSELVIVNHLGLPDDSGGGITAELLLHEHGERVTEWLRERVAPLGVRLSVLPPEKASSGGALS